MVSWRRSAPKPFSITSHAGQELELPSSVTAPKDARAAAPKTRMLIRSVAPASARNLPRSTAARVGFWIRIVCTRQPAKLARCAERTEDQHDGHPDRPGGTEDGRH